MRAYGAYGIHQPRRAYDQGPAAGEAAWAAQGIRAVADLLTKCPENQRDILVAGISDLLDARNGNTSNIPGGNVTGDRRPAMDSTRNEAAFFERYPQARRIGRTGSWFD